MIIFCPLNFDFVLFLRLRPDPKPTTKGNTCSSTQINTIICVTKSQTGSRHFRIGSPSRKDNQLERAAVAQLRAVRKICTDIE